MKKVKMIFILAVVFALSVSAKDHVTRMDCLSSVLSVGVVGNCDIDNNVIKSFSDIPKTLSEQEKQFVCYAVQNEILLGYEDGTLRLDGKVTRAEFACMLYRARAFVNAAPQKIVSSNDTYKDLSAWNIAAVNYCLEYGYMLGYGTEFGCNDPITHTQLNTVLTRMKFGLTTREKYVLQDICGCCAIPLKEILNSAYDVELKDEELPSRAGEHIYAENTRNTASNLESLMEIQGNMNCEALYNQEYVDFISKPFYDLQYENIKRHTLINDGVSVKSIEDSISEAKLQGIHRESIFVISPENNKESSFVNYWRTVGVGYEYYRYISIQGQTPNGEQLGKWYKRKVSIDFTKYTSVSADYHSMIVNYGTPSELDIN